MNRRTSFIYTTAALALPWLTGCASRVATPISSRDAFLSYSAQHGWREGEVDATLLTTTAIGFYRDTPIDGLALDGGDQLLFQWGVYDWGQGPSFEFDITRQFITATELDDDAISQLSITAQYEPTKALATIKPGNAWCKTRNELKAFEQFIRSSSSYEAVLGVLPRKVAVTWSPV